MYCMKNYMKSLPTEIIEGNIYSYSNSRQFWWMTSSHTPYIGFVLMFTFHLKPWLGAHCAWLDSWPDAVGQIHSRTGRHTLLSCSQHWICLQPLDTLGFVCSLKIHLDLS